MVTNLAFVPFVHWKQEVSASRSKGDKGSGIGNLATVCTGVLVTTGCSGVGPSLL